MTRSWPETRLLDAEAAQVRPARFDTHLRTSTLLATPYSDPRVVDPALERIIDDAAERAAFAGREEGFAQGYAEGVVLGRAEAATQAAEQRMADEAALQDALQRLAVLGRSLSAAADSLEQRTAPLYDEVGAELGPLVVELVEALLGRELHEDPAPFVDAVRRAVSRAPHGAPVSVSLNPDDLRTARDLRVDLDHAAGRAVELRADSSVPRGGAVADSGARRIDGCLQPALDRLRAELAP